MHWLVEPGVFADGGARLIDAATARGHRVTVWDDAWWQTGLFPVADDQVVVFHGSLGNAARIARTLAWRPGAYCNVPAFRCSDWYPAASRWLLNAEHVIVPAAELITDAARVLEPLRRPDAVFVRPDSPLKPFSGRVIAVERLSLAALDHGFYFDDTLLPVVVAPVREVHQEFRFVVVDREVVAGGAYVSDGRRETEDAMAPEAEQFARAVAQALPPPEAVYVLDVAITAEGPRLVELNPFSGSDLYGCDRGAIVRALEAHLGS